MKRYTVKQVIPLEKRILNLKDKEASEYITLMGTLSTITLGMATIYSTSIEVYPVLGTLMTVGTAIAGAGMFLEMITVPARRAHLEKKLNLIYQIMGSDFEQQVWLEKEGKLR